MAQHDYGVQLDDAGNEPGGGTTTVMLQAMLSTFADMLSGVDQRMERMEQAVLALKADAATAATLRGTLERLEQAGSVEDDLHQMRVALLDHPAAYLHSAVERMSEQMHQLVAQPGPGPALAMVAAGLAERFEERTQEVVDLLERHIGLMEDMTERVENAMERLRVGVEARQVGLDALLDTVHAVGATVERVSARTDGIAERVEVVAQVGDELSETAAALRDVEKAVADRVRGTEERGSVGARRLLRRESEVLAQRLEAVAGAVEQLQAMMAAHLEEGRDVAPAPRGTRRRRAVDPGVAPPQAATARRARPRVRTEQGG